MADIFLLEDDITLGKGIKISLEKDGHTVYVALSVSQAKNVLGKQSFALYLLDINLPDGSGLDLCEGIRANESTPIIFLTANDTENDMLKGFSKGCDDYIAKPFSVPVLRQKVLALLRRSADSSSEKNLFSYNNLTIDFDRMTAFKNGADCRLTATEYKLLEYMVKNKGHVLTRNMLLENIWDIDGNFIDENTLSVHIKRLRTKLEDDPKNPDFIITVFGIGYTFGRQN